MIVAEVKLWGRTIGVVAKIDESDYCTFRYEPSFISSGIELSPIMMPLSNQIYEFRTLSLKTFKGLPGLLADSLPDKYGNAIINAWLTSEGRSLDSFTIIERLCYIGSRGMGALEFYPAQNKEFEKTEEIELEKLIELSRGVLQHKKDVFIGDKSNYDDIIKVGTSAGGARAKAIIAYNEKSGVIKSGQINAGKDFSYWILKLDGVENESTPYTRIEFAYYLMAVSAGIEMMESRLLERDGRYHFMTKRFDRILKKDGSMEKVHMQTLGSISHTDYNEPGLLSYEETTQLMYQMGMDVDTNEEFFRRMVFNVMSRNQDDHVKNISFLMNKSGEWSLSPAYDMTYAFNPEGEWTSKHQMIINGKREDIEKVDLISSATVMKIKKKRAEEIIKSVEQSIRKWHLYAEEASLPNEVIKRIESSFILFDE